MFETMFAFIAGFLFTWPALVALFGLGVIFEAASWRGMAVFTALIAGFSAYFYFDVPLLMLLAYAVGYLAIGVVWSFWRYKRHTAKVIEDVKAWKGTGSASIAERAIEKMKPSNMISTLVAWIVVWPFSFVENFVGDAIRAVEALVKQVFRGVYNRIYESAVRSLK